MLKDSMTSRENALWKDIQHDVVTVEFEWIGSQTWELWLNNIVFQDIVIGN